MTSKHSSTGFGMKAVKTLTYRERRRLKSISAVLPSDCRYMCLAFSREECCMNVFKSTRRLAARRWEELGWEGKRPSPDGKTPTRRRHMIKL